MNNYDLILVTTHQDEFNIYNLIASIDDNIENINVLLIVLSQESKIVYVPINPLLSIVFIEESKMGLSKARNIAIHYLLNQYSSDYIMFPDDDTLFDKHFFVNFKEVTAKRCCLITPIFNTGSNELYIGSTNQIDFEMKVSDLKLVGSPNQILLYDKLKSHLFFDECLGLGAKYGSSEDMDLFLRLISQGVKFIYTNELYTYHPKKTANYDGKSFVYLITRFNNYSAGYAYLIYKHNLYYFFPNYLFRTIAATIYFLFKFNFKLSLAYFFQFFLRLHKLIFLGLRKILK